MKIKVQYKSDQEVSISSLPVPLQHAASEILTITEDYAIVEYEISNELDATSEAVLNSNPAVEAYWYE